MCDKKLKKYYELLEINLGTTLSEVNRAYERIKKIYSTESVATIQLMMNFQKMREKGF